MLDLSNENVFFVSDTHFNHQKLCAGYPDRFYKYRKYTYTNEMDADIIEQWNKAITKNDVVIFLGDFIYGRPYHKHPEMAVNYYKQLNFKGLIWVEGNHDDRVKNTFTNMMPNLKFKYKDNIYLCQHEPFHENPLFMLQNPDGNVLVHGHTHSDIKTSDVNDLVQNNVCWEAWYRPAHIDELVINTKKNNGSL